MANLSTTTDLTINILSQEKYDQLKLSGLLNPYQLYFTDNILLNAEGERIKNVGSPSLSSDAATKGYVDNKISNIYIPTDLSVFTNSPGYLVSNDISNYYIKSETSNTYEIQSALDEKQDQLSDDQLSAIYQSLYELQTKMSFTDNTTLYFVSRSYSLSKAILKEQGILAEDETTWLKELRAVETGSNVSEIPTGLFQNATSLTRFIGKNITMIWGQAFSGCTALTRVEIPNIINLMASNIFNGCSALTNLTLPKTLTSVARMAFNNNSFQHVMFEGKTLAQVQEMTNYSRWGLTEDKIYTNAFENQLPTKTSELSNDSGYLTEHQSLSNYYMKSETSNAVEISDAISNAEKGYTVIVRKLDNEGTGNGWCFVGGNQIEAQAATLPAGLRIQHVDTSIAETSVYNQSFIIVPNGVNSGGYNTVYVNGAAKNNEVIQLTGDTLVELYYLFCFLEGTMVQLADGTSKPIEDVTYDDVLSVWNFDEGKLDFAKPFWMNKPQFTTYCWETELSSGKKIRTTGVHGHRFFSLDSNKFLYADEVAGHNIWTINGEDLVVSSKLVQDIKAKFYNIITEHHINLFAEGILAGCSLENGLYPVENMKFAKDSRTLRDFSEFEGEVSIEWFDKCRYAESSLSKQYLTSYYAQRNLDKLVAKRGLLKTGSLNDAVGIHNMHNYALRGLGFAELSSDAVTYKQMQDEVEEKLSSYSQVVIKDSTASASVSTLVVNNVTQQEYLALSAAGQTVSSELYIIDPDSINLDAGGDWVTNVKTPELSSDAANKAYVDSQLSNAGGGFSFEMYYPPYNSTAQTYVLKPGKFNILSSRIKNNDNIILEDYTIDQVYKVQLTGNASAAVSVNLLIDTNESDVLPGAYSDNSIASCLTKIARGEVYNFEVSYGNVTFDNDFNGDSLRTMNPYGINPVYGGGYEKYELMPLNNTCNHLSILASASEYDNMQFDLVIPSRVRTNKVRRMRQFSIAFKTEFSERGMSLNFPSTDLNGASVKYTFICGWQYAKAPKQGDVLTFVEYQKDQLFVDIQNVNSNLWYSFVTPTPSEGVVTMKDRCVNYVNIKTTAISNWEWSDGAPNGRNAPSYNANEDPPQWTNSNDVYEIINADAGPNETMLYIYPDQNNHDESTIVTGQFVTSYAINSGNGTIAMPPAIPGKCRDFLLRLRIDASDVPNITFTGANFETESGEFPSLEEGVQVLSFTEVKVGTFMIGYKKLEVAT